MTSSSSSPPRSKRSGWGSLVAWLLCIGLTAAGLRNALASEPGLEALALAAACAGPSPAPLPSASAPRPGKPLAPPPAAPCRQRPTRWESGPLGRSIEFQPPGGGAPVHVQCRREHIALGEYRCTVVP